MELSIEVFLIVCPLVFLAGLVDAIGGGGGLISLPAYMIAGLPPHMAVATNKMSATFGTALATMRFIKAGLVNFKLAIPAVISAVIGSSIGANILLIVPAEIMNYVLIIVLPVSAFLVLNKKIFNDKGSDTVKLDKRTYLTAMASALVVGIYDGFYGPGTGTFLIIAFTIFAKLDIKTANAQAKVINLTTNVTALVILLINGQVMLLLGIVAAACNMVGGYIGAGLAMTKSSNLSRNCIIFVLFLLSLKVIGIY